MSSHPETTLAASTNVVQLHPDAPRRRKLRKSDPMRRERAKIAVAQRVAQATAQAVRDAVAGVTTATPAAASGETVEVYAGRWLASRGKLSSIRDDRSRLRDHVLPLVGTADIATLTRDQVEDVRDSLDGKIAGGLNWKTARNIWSVFRKMLDDATNAKQRTMRVRKDNPAAGVRAPDRGVRKQKQYLFPSEVLAFASCADVPVAWRRGLVIACYLYLRDGELRELAWSDVDLEHATVSVSHAYDRRAKSSKSPKTQAGTRRVPIEPTLLPLLQAMHDASGGDGLVCPDLPNPRTMARALRRWLRRAGVDRDELYEDTATRKPITWHDMRATGVTWLAVLGVDAAKIQRRAGHTDFGTTLGYIREAESFDKATFGTPFPPLPASLLGQQAALQNPSTPRAANPAEAVDGTVSGWTGLVCGVDGTRTCKGSIEPEKQGVSSDLAASLKLAAQAGEWYVVSKLADLLKGGAQ